MTGQTDVVRTHTSAHITGVLQPLRATQQAAEHPTHLARSSGCPGNQVERNAARLAA
jgi:hypothetical protein